MKRRWNISPAKIIDYIKRNFVFKVRREGEEYIICNPLNGDTGFHFNINPKKGVCHDWRGDESWAGSINPKTGKRNVSFLNFIKTLKRCSIQDAYKLITGSDVSLESSPVNSIEVIENDIVLPTGSKPIGEGASTLEAAIILWLVRRGYEKEDVDDQNLHYCGNDVIWPYYEYGELVYWQSRSFVNKMFRFPDKNIYKDGKIVGVSDVSKGDFLYGFDGIEHHGRCFITESIFDKNSIGVQALASGGAILTENQCKKLRLTGVKNVILSPDNDKAGIQSITANYQKLRSYFDSIHYVLPPAQCNGKDIKDWNELITTARLKRNNILEYIEKNIQKLDERSLIRLRLRVK